MRRSKFHRAKRNPSIYSSLCFFLSLTIYIVSVISSHSINDDLCMGDSCLGPSDEQLTARKRVIIKEVQTDEREKHADRKPLVHQMEGYNFTDKSAVLPNTDPDFDDVYVFRSQLDEQSLGDNDDDGHVYTFEDYDDDYAVEAPQYLRDFFAFDDDEIKESNCRRVTWQTQAKPACNSLHEISLGSVDDEGTESHYLASGAYRDAFSVINDTAVLKVSRFDRPYE